MKLCATIVALVMLVALSAGMASAEVKPNPLFSDNCVLQRGVTVPVWGTAADGERVTVAFQNQRASTTAGGGRWMVRLKPLKEGGPFTMTISGTNTVEIKNVLVGEVWLASGQSNMGMQLKSTENAEEVAKASEDAMLRFGMVPLIPSDTPQQETAVKWVDCNPETAPNFSAVAFYFARDLRRTLGCPVAILSAPWGGTRVEAWTSSEALDPFGDKVDRSQVKPGKPANPNKASVLYNGMISPLVPYAIKGAIWYQGESNAGGAYQYQDLFSAMIRDWRGRWGEGDFPFLFVQLAPYGEIPTEPKGSKWAELREAQLLTSRALPNTAMAVITDCGEPTNIHPKRKQPVGERLALAARALAYGEKVTYIGPTFRSMKMVGSRAIMEFDNADRGLVAKDGELTGFTIAGGDGKFCNARATVQWARVVVSSDEVANPVAVRFGWADCPVVNLFNKSGLPASPFRTDDFPKVTAPKAVTTPTNGETEN